MAHLTEASAKRVLVAMALTVVFLAVIAACATSAEAASGPVLPIPDTLWKPPAGSTPATGDYVYLKSDQGDWVGQGGTYLYTPLDASLAVSATGGRLTVGVDGDTWWNGYFQTMSSITSLETGYYPDLQRYPFHDPTKGGLSWSGDGRGSNTLTGWFVVDSVGYVNGELTSIDLRFEQHSEGGAPALHGAIHWGERAGLTLTAPRVCPYGTATLTGCLTDTAGQPLEGATVTIETRSGSEWTTLASVTTIGYGCFELPVTPKSATDYRAVFGGQPGCPGVTGMPVHVLPRVWLSELRAPAPLSTTSVFTATCDLRPSHAAGEYPVTFQCQCCVAGRWVTKKLARGLAQNLNDYTRCWARIRLPVAGSWRIRAVHASDALNALTRSPWRSVTVRSGNGA
jgi:hypothetical protein